MHYAPFPRECVLARLGEPLLSRAATHKETFQFNQWFAESSNEGRVPQLFVETEPKIEGMHKKNCVTEEYTRYSRLIFFMLITTVVRTK